MIVTMATTLTQVLSFIALYNLGKFHSVTLNAHQENGDNAL